MLNICNGEQQMKKGSQLHVKELWGAVVAGAWMDRTPQRTGGHGERSPPY